MLRKLAMSTMLVGIGAGAQAGQQIGVLSHIEGNVSIGGIVLTGNVAVNSDQKNSGS